MVVRALVHRVLLNVRRFKILSLVPLTILDSEWKAWTA